MRRWQRALFAEQNGRFEDLRRHIDRCFEHVNKKLNFIRSNQMASQADIDALTTRLTELGATLTADDSAIQAELARLANQGVDVTALTAAVDALAADVDATTALVPAPTSPTA